MEERELGISSSMIHSFTPSSSIFKKKNKKEQKCEQEQVSVVNVDLVPDFQGQQG
jgi:hypothetical protein